MKKNYLSPSMWFILYYFFMFFYRGTYMSYIGIYFKENLSLNYNQIGLIGSLGSLAAMVCAPLIGSFIARLKSFKKVLFGLSFSFIITLIFYSAASTYIIVLILAVVFEAIKESHVPVVDSYTMVFAERYGQNYGKYRSIGSLGFMMGSLLSGFIIQFFNDNHVLFIILILVISIFTVILSQLPNIEYHYPKTSNKKTNLFSLFKNAAFISIIIIMITTIAINASSNEFFNLHLTEQLKASVDLVGIMTFVRVIPEIFIIAQVHKLIERYGYKKLFFIGTLACGIRNLLTFFVTSPIAFIIVSPIHAIGVGIIIPTALSYLKHVMKAELFASSVSLYASVTMLSVAVLRLFQGYLNNLYSTYSTFIIGSVMALIGCLFIIFFFKEPLKKHTI